MASERGHNTLENQKGKQLHAEEAVGMGWSCFRMDSVPQGLSLVKMGLGNLIYSTRLHLLKFPGSQHHHTRDQASSTQALGANLSQTIAASSLQLVQIWVGTHSHHGDCTETMQLVEATDLPCLWEISETL